MRKVLMVGPGRNVHGGISGVVNNYYAAGLDKKIRLCYIATMVEGSKARKLLQAGIAYLRFLAVLPRYEIVHVHMASDSSYYRKSVFIRTAHFFGKKIVLHQHGGDFTGFYRRELGEKGRVRVRCTLAMADEFLVLAPVWKTFFGEIIGEEKITVLPDAIPVSKREPREYGQHRILFLGRLCREKGVRELLACVPALRERFADVKIYLGGIWEDGDLQEEAARYPQQVEWLGWVFGDEKKKYLRECDIFVLPTYFEGQSLSVMEAMEAACAVVASDTGGIPMMISHQKSGLLVKPKDAEALKEALLAALEDPALCRRLGEQARETVEKEFSMEENMRRLLQIYERVAGKLECPPQRVDGSKDGTV